MSKEAYDRIGQKPGAGQKTVMITRKIQVLPEADGREEWQRCYATLLQWQQIVHKASNWIATHHFIQDNLKDLFYLTEGIKLKLADAGKDPEGILTASRLSTTYRMLSARFKGQIPMAIISSLNSRIIATFDKEKQEYREGRRSLRSYKQDLPIPIVSSDILHIAPCGNPPQQEYTFTLYGLSFRTHFGKDASGNRELFRRLLEGEYKLHDSSLEIRKNKIFLLAVLGIPPVSTPLLENIRAEAFLSLDIPIIASIGETTIMIGNREEYLYRRLAIQGAMSRTQAAIRFSRGGKGRKKKLQALERFRHLEKDYIATRLHQYSARLIDFCRQQKAGVLVLRSQLDQEAEAKENAFLLRNWGYYGLKEKISYKAAKYGIKVVME